MTTAATAILARGELLGGYRIDDIIGIGGMAIVYRAEQLSLGRAVALKVLAPQLSHDASFRERFRREGQHVAALDHPHVLAVHDSGEIDGRLFLAMRLVDGSSLAERLQRDGLSAVETLSLLTPIADALDAAHGIGLVHRDVKPQNILIGQNGHPYLADFGVAKGGTATLGLTGTGGFVGSVNYASPEQIRGLPASPAGDVYALAAVLYECLTGRVPYPRDTDAGVMHAHLNDPPPKLAIAAPEADEFDSVIARGMAKEPTARQETAGELIRAASYALAGLSADDRLAVPTFLVPESVVDDGLPPASLIDASDLRRRANLNRPAAGAAAADLSGRKDQTEVVAPGERRARRRVANVTTADRRRQHPTAPIPAQPSRTLGRRNALVGLGAVAFAAIAGLLVFLTSGGDSSGGRVNVASAGPLTLAYRAPWRASSAASPGSFALALATAGSGSVVKLGSGLASISAGTLTESAPIPGDPPPRLVNRYGQPSSAAATQVGGHPGRRYTWNLANGEQLVARILPTSTSDLAILCSAASRQAVALQSCAVLASSVQASGVQLVAPGPDSKLGPALAADLSPVAALRGQLRELTTAEALPARSSTIDRIGRGDRTAVGRLAPLAPSQRNLASLKALRAGLTAESAALLALGRAATADDRTAYGEFASHVTTISRRVVAAAALIHAQGFATPILGVIEPPGLPPKPVATAAIPTVALPSAPRAPIAHAPGGPASSVGSGNSGLVPATKLH